MYHLYGRKRFQGKIRVIGVSLYDNLPLTAACFTSDTARIQAIIYIAE